jgi:hypothetical protein
MNKLIEWKKLNGEEKKEAKKKSTYRSRHKGPQLNNARLRKLFNYEKT